MVHGPEGCIVLGRRSPIGIRSAEVRLKKYRKKIETGALKFRASLDLMKQNMAPVAEFTAFVNSIVADVADAMGIVGTDRGFLQSAGLRIARFAAKYHNMPVDALAVLLANEAYREIVRGGYLGNDIIANALNEIATRMLENRHELYKKFVSTA